MNRKLVLIMALTLLVGMLSVASNVQKAEASGTIYIRANGLVEGTDKIVTADNVTYTFADNISDSIIVERDNIVVDGAGYTLQGTGAYESKGISLSGRENVTVRNTQIQTSWYGIWLSYASNNSIVGNSITENNGHGIMLEYSSNNTISWNNITANQEGIRLYRSSNNLLHGNTVKNNGDGIVFWESCSNNRVYQSNIANNTHCNVWIQESSENVIAGNNIVDSGEGIGFDYSSNNKVYHNYFAANDRQVVFIHARINIWDIGYPSGGNYWSNYTGVDLCSGPYQNVTGSDGTGDTPHIIDENNQDRYPLTHPWSPLPVHNMNTGLGHAMIQEAINAPETLDGHTILIDNGTYYEHVVVSKSLTLVGENTENTIIDGNGTGIIVYVTANNVTVNGFTIQNSGGIYQFGCGIAISNSNNSIIVNNNIICHPGTGVSLSFSDGNVLIGNTLTSNENNGIVLDHSCDNSVINNDLASGGSVELSYSSGNIVSDNTISSSNYNGIGISRCNGNTITNNTIANNTRYGILLQESNSSIIAGNIIANNEEGLQLFCSVCDNTIVGNIISNNGRGIYQLCSSKDNNIYHNSFVNNTWQAKSDEDSVSTWDDGYPSGGNYWSNHTKVDADSDGIDDTPYVIDGNNTDSYPLMGVFSDFNATSEYHVQTICNSSISDFQSNGTSISFNVTGEDGTVGFCRICIPTALMNAIYKVFVNGTEVPYILLPCSNSTQSYLYFNYTHSTEEVTITPEFPSFLILPLFMIATLLAVIAYRRRQKRLDQWSRASRFRIGI